MVRHKADLDRFNLVLKEAEIKNGENASKLFGKDSADGQSTLTKDQLYDKGQSFLELIVHAADVSTNARPFDVAKQWSYMLYEEFFAQGDAERELNMPVSMLCDRETTRIPLS